MATVKNPDLPSLASEPVTDRTPGGRLQRRSTRVARAGGERLAGALVTLFLISLLTFMLMNYQSPTAVARNVLGRDAVPEQLKAYAKEHGLDRPVLIRYGSWLGDFVRGNWGTSYVTGRPVRPDIQPRLLRTMWLALISLLVAAPLSILLGIATARRVGSPLDLSLLVISTAVTAIPEFVLGVALLLLFAVELRWLPVGSAGISFGSWVDEAKAYVLPMLTLVISMIPYISRMARATVRETLASPYVQSAVLRGVPTRRVVWNYGVRNAAAPLIQIIALNLVYLLSGIIVVENVFGFPGVGQQLVEAISTGDTITVQAIALLLGAMFIGISLSADLLVLHFTPRLRGSSH